MSQIKATIIADSISTDGQRITTFELEYPRFIHGEVMTHRVFSRNAASSRAIPVNAMMALIEESPAQPVEWGMNRSGMQASELHESPSTCEWAWNQAAKSAVEQAKVLQGLVLHKQIVNRVLEPFQIMKTVVTATEYDNFFYLRNHSDAQPEIARLAELMYEVHCKSSPVELPSGMWHVPYVTTTYNSPEDCGYSVNGIEVSQEDALKISASCCAQVSYRKQDESLEKALKIWDMLVTMTPVHASPFEHQATPMLRTNGTISENCNDPVVPAKWQDGVTHFDKKGKGWSANFKGWIQHRQLIDNNVCNDYEGEK